MPFLVWIGVEEWFTEAAAVGIEVPNQGLGATGIQLGAEPSPYRVDYRLDAHDGFVTRAIDLTSHGDGWRRRLELVHDGAGHWEVDLLDDDGDVPGGPWDGSLPDLSEALDIDIENSPLTNMMPILRHGFQRAGSGDFLMAFIETPSLRVEASPQRYEHVRATGIGSVVRYISRDGDFTADLELDGDGLLTFYPRLARRVKPGLRVD
ncbi:MAG TPA: putative glycolipid-binding domain-containing protein [Solirubrobacterales bacterium]|nr:putative glycolipid-binding domain-containing protein [Solirubrobacterales bacterium]